MSKRKPPLLFALEGSREFGEAVARRLGTELADHEERDFEDGEHKIRPLVGARGRDVFVLHALHGDPGGSPNDKLNRMLFLIGALKDGGAARVAAVTPYLCYARKDRQTKPRDPVTTRYVARLFEAVGCDAIVTMDVHNIAAYQNAFRIPTVHLDARKLFIDHFLAELTKDEPVAVISPDAGGVKRAEAFRRAFAHYLARPVGNGFMEKRRSEGKVTGQMLVGEIEGRTVILFDDLISSGGTLVRGARACLDKGAVRVMAAATHGLFMGDAGSTLADEAIENLVITNTVPPFRIEKTPAAEKLTVLDAAPAFAEAIWRMHEGASIVELTNLPEVEEE